MATKKQLPQQEDVSDVLPDVLPDGCKRRANAHLNMGSKGHVMTYDIYLPNGKPLPIHAQSCSTATFASGYFIRGSDVCYKTWSEVRAAWPKVVLSLRANRGAFRDMRFNKSRFKRAKETE